MLIHQKTSFLLCRDYGHPANETPDDTWWTRELLDPIMTNEKTRQISYVQVSRNANFKRENRDHYYAPFPGQVSADNFVGFRNHPAVLFEEDLPPMYE